MLPKNKEPKRDQHPAPKDEHVKKESQLQENLNSIQPMGNEAANAELAAEYYTNMLKEMNADNELDVSESEDQHTQ